MTPSLSHSHGWHTIGGDPTLAAREGRECVSHTPHEFRPMVFLRRHPVMGPIGMMLSVVSLCGIVFATSAHAIDWSPLIPDGDGIVAGANGRDDSTWIATLLVVLGAVVGLAIFGGVCLFLRLTLTTFKEGWRRRERRIKPGSTQPAQHSQRSVSGSGRTIKSSGLKIASRSTAAQRRWSRAWASCRSGCRPLSCGRCGRGMREWNRQRSASLRGLPEFRRHQVKLMCDVLKPMCLQVLSV